MALVYLITNTVNGKKYVGATITPLEKRWSRHKCDAAHNRGNMALHAAIRKYGPDAFTVQLLEEHADQDYVFDVLEKQYIIEHKSSTAEHGYNQTSGGDGWLGMQHRPESIEKMRKAKLGKKASEATKRKMSLANRGRKAWNEGISCPQISAGKAGQRHTDASKQSMAASHVGGEHTKETKDKIRSKLAEKHLVKIKQTGEEIWVTNLHQFCREHGLNHGNMIALGSSKGHLLLETIKTVRKYHIKNLQTGQIDIVENLRQHCKNLNISDAGLLTKYRANKPYLHYQIVDVVYEENRKQRNTC